MSSERKWNYQSLTTGNNIFGYSQTYVISSPGENIYLQLHHAQLILKIIIKGLKTDESYEILRPSVDWINQISVTIEAIIEGEKRVIHYPNFNRRGLAAHILELMEYSKPKIDMYNSIEFITKPSTNPDDATFEVLIPFKYLCDIAYDNNLLNITQMTLEMSFKPIGEIIKFKSDSEASVHSTKLDLLYTSTIVSSHSNIPRALTELPNRSIYLHFQEIPIGASSVTATPTVPFPCSVVYYFFNSKTEGYNFNPNPNAVVTDHSITTLGATYPLTTNYNSMLDDKNSCGLVRHYMEFIQLSGKDRTEANSFFSFENWKNSYRIYAIEIGTPQNKGLTFNFLSNFSQATTNGSNCVIMFVGRKPLNIS